MYREGKIQSLERCMEENLKDLVRDPLSIRRIEWNTSVFFDWPNMLDMQSHWELGPSLSLFIYRYYSGIHLNFNAKFGEEMLK